MYIIGPISSGDGVVVCPQSTIRGRFLIECQVFLLIYLNSTFLFVPSGGAGKGGLGLGNGGCSKTYPSPKGLLSLRTDRRQATEKRKYLD